MFVPSFFESPLVWLANTLLLLHGCVFSREVLWPQANKQILIYLFTLFLTLYFVCMRISSDLKSVKAKDYHLWRVQIVVERWCSISMMQHCSKMVSCYWNGLHFSSQYWNTLQEMLQTARGIWPFISAFWDSIVNIMKVLKNETILILLMTYLIENDFFFCSVLILKADFSPHPPLTSIDAWSVTLTVHKPKCIKNRRYFVLSV